MTKCTALLCGLVFAATIVGINESRAAFEVNMSFNGVSPTLTGKVKYSNSSGSHNTGSIYIGALNWHVNTSTNSLVSAGSNLITFCIELDSHIKSPYNYKVGSVSSAPNPNSSSPLPGGIIDTLRASYLTKLYDLQYDNLFTGTTDEKNSKAAAFQLAIWELSHETSTVLNVLNGNGIFYLAAGASSTLLNAAALANQWLADVLDTSKVVLHKYDTYALISCKNQDQIFAVEVSQSNAAPVPEATAMATWALVLLSAGAFSRPTRRVAA